MAQAGAALEAWYREQLKEAVPPLLARWEPLVGVEVELTTALGWAQC